MKKSKRQDVRAQVVQATPIEAEVAEGLETVAADEIRQRFGSQIETMSTQRGAVRFRYRGNLHALRSLGTAQSVYSVQTFRVPRPKALLGDENFRIVLSQINTSRALDPHTFYSTLYIGAAGAESSVMTRLRKALLDATGLREAHEQGDLLLRIRKGSNDTWETLVRLSPRPLASRAWRVCNYEGALNAGIAQAMIRLSRPTPSDRFLNVASGSGTLLIERLAWGRANAVIGVDNDPDAIQCASVNILASGHRDVSQLCADARKLPFPAASADVLVADLPFGQLIGSHTQNKTLYPSVLTEAARIACTGARFVVLTHEIRLMDDLLSEHPFWNTEQVIRITLRGLHPRIYVLNRH